MLLCVPLTAQSKKSVVVSVVPIFQSNLKQLNFEYVDLSVYDFSSVPHWTDDEVLKAGDNPPWKVYASQIKTVWILPDFKNVELTSLANWFSGCTNLSYIKCLATTMTATDCTTGWVEGVAANGTFVKAASADWSVKTGNDGIPAGWTVQDA